MAALPKLEALLLVPGALVLAYALFLAGLFAQLTLSQGSGPCALDSRNYSLCRWLTLLQFSPVFLAVVVLSLLFKRRSQRPGSGSTPTPPPKPTPNQELPLSDAPAQRLDETRRVLTANRPASDAATEPPAPDEIATASIRSFAEESFADDLGRVDKRLVRIGSAEDPTSRASRFVADDLRVRGLTTADPSPTPPSDGNHRSTLQQLAIHFGRGVHLLLWLALLSLSFAMLVRN
jgi:hypothetical protein